MVELPESVLSYFSKRSVGTAVDLLLTGKRHKVPEDLKWSEVASFYSACLAARQTPVEFAIVLTQLWSAIWQDGPKGWTSCPPQPPMRPDLGIEIDTIWDEGCFTRCFTRDDKIVELSVGIFGAKAGVQLGICLYDTDDESLYGEAFRKAGWELDPEYYVFWTPTELVGLSAKVEMSPLERFRDEALAIVMTKR